MIRAIFLDRDGVIGENRADHVKSWEEFRFLPGALDALRWLRLAGFHTFVVTNQAIVNRGLASAQVVEEIHDCMSLCVAWHGGRIDDIRYCPHDYGEQCECRKPRPGMLMQLAKRWNIDLSCSYMIGDAWTDIAAGRAASCRACIMVRTGRGAEQVNLPESRQFPADHLANDLYSAVAWLFQQERVPLLHPRSNLMSLHSTAVQWNAARSVPA
jgi:D-glycero-D-manno-heptose 1,7-bisphosphate phosphatase